MYRTGSTKTLGKSPGVFKPRPQLCSSTLRLVSPATSAMRLPRRSCQA